MAMPTDKAMYMVERSQWKPVPPLYRLKCKRPFGVVILRHTNTDPCTDEASCEQAVRDIQADHIDKTHVDLLYNFLIGGDGRVYEGSGWRYCTNKEDDYGMHDFENCDIAYIGHSQKDVTPDMRWAARKLLEHSYVLEQIKIGAEMIGDKEALDLLYT